MIRGLACEGCARSDVELDTWPTSSGRRVVLCDGCATADERDVAQALRFYEVTRVEALVRLLRDRRLGPTGRSAAFCTPRGMDAAPLPAAGRAA